MFSTPSKTAAYIRTIIRQRRARSKIASACRFSDPAWDILLDLTASRLEGRQISVSSACIAANVPATTALRCIENLVRDGALVRHPAPNDGRSVIVTTTDHIHEKMLSYLSERARALAEAYDGEGKTR